MTSSAPSTFQKSCREQPTASVLILKSRQDQMWAFLPFKEASINARLAKYAQYWVANEPKKSSDPTDCWLLSLTSIYWTCRSTQVVPLEPSRMQSVGLSLWWPTNNELFNPLVCYRQLSCADVSRIKVLASDICTGFRTENCAASSTPTLKRCASITISALIVKDEPFLEMDHHKKSTNVINPNTITFHHFYNHHITLRSIKMS